MIFAVWGLVAILFANGTIDDNIWTHIKDFVETQTWNNWEERICQSFCNFNILCPKCLIISLIFGHKFLKSNEIWPARLCTGQSKKTTGFQEFFNTISQNHCWERIVNDIFTKELESLKVKFAGKGGKAGKGRKGGFSLTISLSAKSNSLVDMSWILGQKGLLRVTIVFSKGNFYFKPSKRLK